MNGAPWTVGFSICAVFGNYLRHLRDFTIQLTRIARHQCNPGSSFARRFNHVFRHH
jgi:hypothetical protein